MDLNFSAIDDNAKSKDENTLNSTSQALHRCWTWISSKTSSIVSSIWNTVSPFISQIANLINDNKVKIAVTVGLITLGYVAFNHFFI
jgi:hypothetical protein